jgi:hypothetical protein
MPNAIDNMACSLIARYGEHASTLAEGMANAHAASASAERAAIWATLASEVSELQRIVSRSGTESPFGSAAEIGAERH